jgi:hypothetical protein
MNTMFSNAWATPLRRQRGSGKRAKNRLMETGVSEDERAMDSLPEASDLQEHHLLTPCPFQCLHGKEFDAWTLTLRQIDTISIHLFRTT